MTTYMPPTNADGSTAAPKRYDPGSGSWVQDIPRLMRMLGIGGSPSASGLTADQPTPFGGSGGGGKPWWESDNVDSFPHAPSIADIQAGINLPPGVVPTNGGGTGGPSTPGVGQIQTSINPRPVYSDSMTATARNMAVNDAMRRTSPISAYKRFDAPGRSRSLATQQLAMPTIAKAYTDAAKAKAGIPLADLIANEQNLFQGQLARANEFMGLGRLQLGEQSLNNYSIQQLLQALAPILGSLF